MAKMYPENIDNFPVTKSEKIFFKELKAQLKDSITVFHSVAWYRTVDGNRVNSECDFLLFDPDFGYLTIEVKGGTKLVKVNQEWRLYGFNRKAEYEKLKRSPFAQAQESMWAFKEYFKEQFGENFPGIFGFACSFPNYTIDEDFGPEAPQEVIIDFDDLRNLGKKVNEIFHYWKGKSNRFIFISPETRERFIRMVNRQIVLAYSKKAYLERTEEKLSEVNRMQDNYLDLVSNYNQAAIVGGAGTGKTWLCLKKAAALANEDKQVLVLCYNSALADFLGDSLYDYDKVQVKTFHQLITSIMGNDYIQNKGFELNNIFDEVIEADNLPIFDAVLIDEAQDYSEEWALIARSFLKYEALSSFYVFYDEQQNIFKRDFARRFSIGNEPFLLRENLRNTAEISNFAAAETGFGVHLRPSLIQGVPPEKNVFTRAREARNRIGSILNDLLLKEKVSNRSITILSNRKLANSILATETQLGCATIVEQYSNTTDTEILYRTIQGFKGLESDIVIFLDHRPPNLDVNKELLYVGLTRAKYLLYVIQYKEKN